MLARVTMVGKMLAPLHIYFLSLWIPSVQAHKELVPKLCNFLWKVGGVADYNIGSLDGVVSLQGSLGFSEHRDKLASASLVSYTFGKYMGGSTGVNLARLCFKRGITSLRNIWNLIRKDWIGWETLRDVYGLLDSHQQMFEMILSTIPIELKHKMWDLGWHPKCATCGNHSSATYIRVWAACGNFFNSRARGDNTLNLVGNYVDLRAASHSPICADKADYIRWVEEKLGMASALDTLCGQAYGARQYHMLGVYLQRSWIVVSGCAVLLLPMYIFATPILKLLGQPDDIAELSGTVSIWLIPLHFAQVFSCTLQRYLQSQVKNRVIAWLSAGTFLLHIFLSWLFIVKLDMGLMAAAMTLNISWWLPAIGQFVYIYFGGCPLTWSGFSTKAFSELWTFAKLSAASGVMLWQVSHSLFYGIWQVFAVASFFMASGVINCFARMANLGVFNNSLEFWYYRVLVLLTGNLNDPRIAVDSLSICMNVNGWEMMIHLAFFAATCVRVANELGAGNGKGAKFAVIVSVATSSAIGLVFWVLIFFFRNDVALMFTDSSVIQEAVSRLAILLSFTILLNSVQPVLSGVAVGSGWQSYVAYVNIGCYYLIGVPFGVLLGWVFNLGVLEMRCIDIDNVSNDNGNLTCRGYGLA
eukprot:Gb_13391 [translate_table: standard]